MKRELPELLELGGKKKLLLGRSGDGGEPPVATSLNDARQQMQCATQNNHIGGLDTAVLHKISPARWRNFVQRLLFQLVLIKYFM